MNNLNIEELNYAPCCNNCGKEYVNQKEVDKLIYSRTTSSTEIYYCSDCKKESVEISKTEQQ